MPGTRYGCIPWTEWYRIAWREVCALLRGEELPPRAEPVPPPAVRSPRPKPPPKEPRPPGPRHEYYLEHREKMLAQSRAYKEAHQEELREKRRADYVRKKGADK
jgi:hypothetical protein